MKRIVLGFMICLFFGNCSKKREIKEENLPYIISKNYNKKIIRGNVTVPPPPPTPGWLIYGTNTFIINSDSTLYYFQNSKTGYICGTRSEFDTIPHFINLQPKDIIEIPVNSITDFIKLNYKDDFRNITFIASKSDTLKSKIYFDLKKALDLSLSDRDFYQIRRTTQEEDTVLIYKKSNKYYNSDDIRWDKTRIKFPELIKFVKRKE
ncbi:hypothetical protein AAGV28_00125 [Flavobacterium sp. FZUC8N2.13]|uniref:Lipoprotein n=1 Tax=Flavobacterium zubiriense TaxID=3138075 RepID=A0ABV4T6I9_9FLAO